MSRTKQDILQDVVGPLAGGIVAGHVADFFRLLTTMSLPAALAAFSGTTPIPVVLGFVSLFGASVLASGRGAAQRARVLEDNFRQIHTNTHDLHSLVQSFSEDGEVFAKLSRFEQAELADVVAGRISSHFARGGRIELHLRTLLRTARLSTAADLHQLSQALAGATERIEAQITDLRNRILLAAEPTLELKVRPWKHVHTYHNPLYYGVRLVPLLGRDEELSRLQEFLGAPRPAIPAFRWWLWAGAAGTGKSRLALELCLKASTDWDCGFLSRRDATRIDWKKWTPRYPTLIVVDYALTNFPLDTGTLVAHLTSRAHSLRHPVRLLALDREAEGPRFERAFQTSVERFEAELIHDSRYDVPVRLQPLHRSEDLEGVVSATLEGFQLGTDPATVKEIAESLKRAARSRRPLYAALAALQARRDPSAPRMPLDKLVPDLIRSERARWSSVASNESRLASHENLLAVTTLVGGCALEDENVETKLFASLQRQDMFPRLTDYSPELFATMAGVEFSDAVDHLPALEPDLIGEAFVIERVQGVPAPLARALIETAWTLAPEQCEACSSNAIGDYFDSPAVPKLLAFATSTPERSRAWARLALRLIQHFPEAGSTAAAEALRRRFAQIAESSSDAYVNDLYVQFGVALIRASADGAGDRIAALDALARQRPVSGRITVQLSIARSEAFAQGHRFAEARDVLAAATPFASGEKDLVDALESAAQRVDRLSAVPDNTSARRERFMAAAGADLLQAALLGLDSSRSTPNLLETFAPLTALVGADTDGERMVDALEYLWSQVSLGRSAALLGEPGSGKTTLLSVLGVRAITELNRAAMLVRLRRITDRSESLLEWANGLREVAPIEERDALEGRVLFLIDGWDEVPAELRSRARRITEEARAVYSTCSFLIASRTTSWTDFSERSDLPVVRLQPLDTSGIKELLTRRLRATAREDVAAFGGSSGLAERERALHRALTNPQLADLARTPLGAVLMATVIDAFGDLPPTTDAVYDRFIDLRLRDWDRARSVRRRSAESTDDLVHALELLAHHALEQGRAQIPESDAAAWLVSLFGSLDRTNEILRSLVDESQLLVLAAGLLSFTDRGLQEHLAKRWRARRSE